MSILKPLAKGTVAVIAVAITSLAGASTASALPVPTDLTGLVGGVTKTTDVAAQVTADLRTQLQAELADQVGAEVAADVTAEVMADVEGTIDTALADPASLDAVAVADLEAELEASLASSLGVGVDLDLDLGVGLGVGVGSVELLDALDLDSLLGKVLGLLG